MWGPEISPDVSPGEAGLGHLIDVDRKAFIGREAVLGQRDRGFGRRLATFYVDTDDAYPRHHEPVFLAGTETQVGRIASGAYGHRVDSAIATALVPEHLLADPQAAFEVELLGERRPARLGPTVPYDPDNARQRA
jgi:dimethylglycine dehydrogenase